MAKYKQKYTQMKLPFPAAPCKHESCFITMAYVPAGLVCSQCGKLLFQYIPQSPSVLGYVSADWAWKHIHGKEWTTRV